MAIAPEQRVFLNSDWVAANLTFLSEILISVTSHLKSVYAAVFDVKKDFETVQHAPLLNISSWVNMSFPYLAFADDLVLVASSHAGLQSNLDNLVRGLTIAGLVICPEKSHSISFVSVGKTRKIKVLTETTFKLGYKYLTPLEVTECWKYLGISFTARGVKTFRKKIEELLRRISEAPLKTFQRMDILWIFLLPSGIYQLLFARVGIAILKALDILVRAAVRRWLKLLRDVAVGFFTAPPSASGLGIPSFLRSIPIWILAYLRNEFELEYPPAHSLVDCPYFSRRVEWAEREAVVDGHFLGSTLKVKNFWKAKLLGTVDGRDLETFKGSKLSTTWIVPDVRMIPVRDYVSYLQIVSNSLPTRLRTSHGSRADRVLPKCRVGCNEVESAYHISQQCVRTHETRTVRDNKITQVVADRYLKRLECKERTAQPNICRTEEA
ncbi:hypothetical protein PR048_024604 [Dryococelus australis]|uniref:Reverse transcriptase n=1 Tax=Dryococelus australis TaxID=614101 RepID=A0ABQ9GP09_9NEOP|nr:hypothetical protein PR048_024604 [Dryococelus australis]